MKTEPTVFNAIYSAHNILNSPANPHKGNALHLHTSAVWIM